MNYHKFVPLLLPIIALLFSSFIVLLCVPTIIWFIDNTVPSISNGSVINGETISLIPVVGVDDSSSNDHRLASAFRDQKQDHSEDYKEERLQQYHQQVISKQQHLVKPVNDLINQERRRLKRQSLQYDQKKESDHDEQLEMSSLLDQKDSYHSIKNSRGDSNNNQRSLSEEGETDATTKFPRRMTVKYNTEQGIMLIMSIASRIYHNFYNDQYIVIDVDSYDDILKLQNDHVNIQSIFDDNYWSGQGILEQIVPLDQIKEYARDHPEYFATTTRSNSTNISIANRQLEEEIIPYGIRMVQADTVSVGPYPITVCIVDTGVAITHPDLNPYAINGSNRLSSGSDATAQLLQWNMDRRGHGTHIAGTIAAKMNNHYGVRGIGNIPLYIVRGLDDTGFARESDIRQAIEQCEEAEAESAETSVKVISLSLAGPAMSDLMKSVIDRLYSKNILLVAAAGNEGKNIDAYPASYKNVISVAAVNEDASIWSLSNYGPSIELAAPGESILSTSVGIDGVNTYATYSGTSMATPHVAGAAAILWSYFPTCRATQIRYALAKTAKQPSELYNNDGTTDTHSCNDQYGYGIIQIRDALEFLKITPCHRHPTWGRTVGNGTCSIL